MLGNIVHTNRLQFWWTYAITDCLHIINISLLYSKSADFTGNSSQVKELVMPVYKYTSSLLCCGHCHLPLSVAGDQKRCHLLPVSMYHGSLLHDKDWSVQMHPSAELLDVKIGEDK
jgi:hypothetical protein